MKRAPTVLYKKRYSMGPGIDKEGFDRKIETTHKKLEGLMQRMSTSSKDASIATEALEELSTTLEELHVASDEQSRQNMELEAAHLAAQAERQRYQDLFDFAPDGYLVTDTNGVIREANRAAADLLHMSQERLVGKPLAVYVAEAERKAFRDILSTLLKRAITGANEWEIGLRPRTGKELRASITVTPVVPISTTQQPAGNEATDGVGLRWSLRDITEIKRAEERERLLEESHQATQEAVQANQLLQTLLDTMPVGVTVCDPDGTIRKINRTGQEILGGTVTGNVRAPVRNFELFYPDGRRIPPEETLMIRALEGKEIVKNAELLIRRADGSQRSVLAGSSPVLDAEGQVVSGVSIFQDITERKQAENALRKSEADLRAILDATKESIWMFDPDGSILMANETALKRINRSAEEMIDQPYSKFLTAELAQARQACLQKVVESGQPVELEDERAGIIFHHIFYPVKDSAGSVVRITAFSKDITERKQAEQALQESEERFKAIASNTPDHILVQDRDLRYTFVVNPQLGLTEQDMLGKTDLDFLTKEDAENLTQIKRHVLETGKPIHLEVPLLPVAGEAQFFDGTYVPKYDAEGQIDGLIGYFKNITELKRIEAALRASEERYRNLFNTMDEGFCIVEMIFDAQQRPVDYRFLEVNPAFEKQTGLYEAQGKLMRTLAPEHEAHWFESYGKVAQTGEPVHFINEARQLNRWYEVYAYRIGMAEDRRVAIIFNDISERKQAEEKLQTSNDELRRFNKAMVGRELRMVELKNEINELCRRAGLPVRYCKEDGAQNSDNGTQTIDNRGTT